MNAVVVDQVFQLGSATAFPAALISELFARGSNGDRMVALLLLQTRPSADALASALDAIEHPRSPFEQYHGLRAADLTMHLLNRSQKDAVTAVLDRARKKYLIPANHSPWQVYLDVAAKLAPGRRASVRPGSTTARRRATKTARG